MARIDGPYQGNLPLLWLIIAATSLSSCKAEDSEKAAPAKTLVNEITPVRDFSQQNLRLDAKKRSSLFYTCQAALKNSLGGQALYSQLIHESGSWQSSDISWKMALDSESQEIEPMGWSSDLSLEVKFYKLAYQDIDNRQFSVSWGDVPTGGSWALAFVGKDGTRVNLPVSSKSSGIVSARVPWDDLYSAVQKNDGLNMVISFPGSTEVRQFELTSYLLKSVAQTLGQLQNRAGEDRRDFKRRCEAHEPIPPST